MTAANASNLTNISGAQQPPPLEKEASGNLFKYAH